MGLIYYNSTNSHDLCDIAASVDWHHIQDLITDTITRLGYGFIPYVWILCMYILWLQGNDYII